jgi:ATP-dependent Lon protease
MLKISEQVHSSVENKLSKTHREFYLRQQVYNKNNNNKEKKKRAGEHLNYI